MWAFQSLQLLNVSIIPNILQYHTVSRPKSRSLPRSLSSFGSFILLFLFLTGASSSPLIYWSTMHGKLHLKPILKVREDGDGGEHFRKGYEDLKSHGMLSTSIFAYCFSLRYTYVPGVYYHRSKFHFSRILMSLAYILIIFHPVGISPDQYHVKTLLENKLVQAIRSFICRTVHIFVLKSIAIARYFRM